MKLRSIPLSVRVRNALKAYLKLRLDENEEAFYLGQRGSLSVWGIHASVKKYAYQSQQEDVTSDTFVTTSPRAWLMRVRWLIRLPSCWTTRV